MVTTVSTLTILYVMMVVAHGLVFKRLHERDEEILRIMDEDMLLAAQIPFKRTGS